MRRVFLFYKDFHCEYFRYCYRYRASSVLIQQLATPQILFHGTERTVAILISTYIHILSQNTSSLFGSYHQVAISMQPLWGPQWSVKKNKRWVTRKIDKRIRSREANLLFFKLKTEKLKDVDFRETGPVYIWTTSGQLTLFIHLLSIMNIFFIKKKKKYWPLVQTSKVDEVLTLTWYSCCTHNPLPSQKYPSH